MFSWLSSAFGAVNPLMLWGGLAVASPIIIHLLSKRKFRIIDWAAMDFLLEAERQNRRRVRIENLILLLLRCLAMAVIAAMIARPFLTPSGSSAAAVGSDPFERIFIIDDSPSMNAVSEQEIVFDRAKKRVTDFLDALLLEQSRDNVTVYRTSQPEEPVLLAKAINTASVLEMKKEINNLEPADRVADLSHAILTLAKRLETEDAKQANRTVYLVTDLQEKDWPINTTDKEKEEKPNKDKAEKKENKASDNSSTSKAIEILTKSDNQQRALVQGFVLVDVGSQINKNLILSEIALRDMQGVEGSLVAGMEADFEVSVYNAGTQSVEDVLVTLELVGYATLSNKLSKIKSISPGQTKKVPFKYTMPYYKKEEDELGNEVSVKTLKDIIIKARVGRDDDQLRVDDERIFATKLSPGIQVLIVDGNAFSDDILDPASERYFIQKVIGLPDVSTGFVVHSISDDQFEALDLSPYQLIYLLNISDFSEDGIDALYKFAENGGGIIFALGDQVDPDHYNEKLYKIVRKKKDEKKNGDDDKDKAKPDEKTATETEEKQLMPVKLLSIEGDEKHKTWATLTPRVINHPAGKVFEIEFFAKDMKAFQYWKVKPAASATVVATYSNDDETPAIIEKSIGTKGGHVLVFMNTLNVDWTNWPLANSWAPYVAENSEHMAAKITHHHNLVPGDPVSLSVDPSKYKEDIAIQYQPIAEKSKVVKTNDKAIPDNEDIKSQILKLNYKKTDRAGLYKFILTTQEGVEESKLYAANIDPQEGILQRISHQNIRKQLPDTKINIVVKDISSSTGIEGSKTELWKYLLLAMGLILGIEQFLAWFFGRKRSS